jgi:hypothetical protein
MTPTPRQVAVAVCATLGGSTADAVLAPQRGTPRTAYLRAVSMWVWRSRHSQQPVPSLTATGLAFGRDRRNVARGFQRIWAVAAPLRSAQLNEILERL